MDRRDGFRQGRGSGPGNYLGQWTVKFHWVPEDLCRIAFARRIVLPDPVHGHLAEGKPPLDGHMTWSVQGGFNHLNGVVDV